MNVSSLIKRWSRPAFIGAAIYSFHPAVFSQESPLSFRVTAKRSPELKETVRTTIKVRVDGEWKPLCEIEPEDGEFTSARHPAGNSSRIHATFENPWLSSPVELTHTGDGDLIIEAKPKSRIYTLSVNYSRALIAGDAAAASAIAFLAAGELSEAGDPGADYLQRDSWALLGQSLKLEGKPMAITGKSAPWISPELKEALVQSKLSPTGKIDWSVYESIAGSDFPEFARATVEFPKKGDSIEEPWVVRRNGKWNPAFIMEVGLPAGGEIEILKRRLGEAILENDFGVAAMLGNELAFRLRDLDRELSLRYQKDAWDYSAKALGLDTPAWIASESNDASPSEVLLKATRKFKLEKRIAAPDVLDYKFYRELSGSDIGAQLSP